MTTSFTQKVPVTVLQYPTRLSVFVSSARLLGAVAQVVRCAKASGKREERVPFCTFAFLYSHKGAQDAKEALVGELRFSPLSLLAAAFIFFNDHCLL